MANDPTRARQTRVVTTLGSSQPLLPARKGPAAGAPLFPSLRFQVGLCYRFRLFAFASSCLAPRSNLSRVSATLSQPETMCGPWLTIVLAWERRPLTGAGASPEQGRCAGMLDQRPCLGETWLLERGIGRFSAQRPGLGETRCFWQGRSAAFPQVDEPVFLASSPKAGSCAARSLPSRDVAPESPIFLAERQEFLPSRDVVHLSRSIVPAWEK